METKVKSRDWVKNAAIVFLSVLLVLTFFSNTIMNRSLPEVSTQLATNGSIVAKVRGTGVVVANGSYQEKAEQTREIRAVMIKSGQQINAGDPMFILGEGDSEELEALQESLRSLQVSYQRSSINTPTFDYTLEEKKIKTAQEAVKAAEIAEAQAFQDLLDATRAELQPATDKLNAAKERLEAAKQVWQKCSEDYNQLTADIQAEIAAAEQKLKDEKDALQKAKDEEAAATEENKEQAAENVKTAQANVDAAEKALQAAWDKLATQDSTALDDAQAEVDARQAEVDRFQKEVDAITGSAGGYNAAYQAAKTQHTTAKDTLENLKYELEEKKAQDNKTQQLAYLDLSDIGAQIAKVQEQIKELSGGDENQIIAKVSGTVQSVEVTAGSTAAEGTVLATIEVPDMGYNLSFSVTNEQARRLKIGDTATVSNYYWGNQIVATLSAIKTDPKSPMTNKQLTFELEGDVTAGGELSLSVGQKSAGYDVVVPNSAIKNDTNGNFVYIIEAKNSPLGNRYIAKRASVEVLAADDNNSAVTGDIENGDYVITISNAPIKNGDMVRMADS